MNRLDEQWLGTRFPPGGFPFQDQRTGQVFNAMAGGMEDRIIDVQKHRRANPNIYPEEKYHTTDFIRQEIIDFMCNAKPSICGGQDPVAPRSPAALVQTVECPKCGSSSNAKPEFCASCGGNRIKFWICSCGEKF